MATIETTSFRKNFLYCKLMFKESQGIERQASQNKDYKKANIEIAKQQLIAKIAFMEFCGWIETTLDDTYISIGKTQSEQDLIKRHIVSCYSFKERDVTKNLKYCLGENKYNTLINKYKNPKIAFFKKLNDIAEYRNAYAHTSLDIGALPGGQPGIKQIQDDFLNLLEKFMILYIDLI